jgi:hypothetical protein
LFFFVFIFFICFLRNNLIIFLVLVLDFLNL